MLKLSGLWVNTDKNGKKYMVGYLGQQRVLIMKNNFKEEENQPDYNLYVAEGPKQQEEAADFEEEDAPL